MGHVWVKIIYTTECQTNDSIGSNTQNSLAMLPNAKPKWCFSSISQDRCMRQQAISKGTRGMALALKIGVRVNARNNYRQLA